MRKLYKSIAPATFSSCIKDLLLNKLVKKTDAKERGTKIYYSLTNKGKQHFKLLLKGNGTESKGTSSEETKRRMGLYFLIFLFSQHPPYTFNSKEFAALLSKNNLSEEDLTWHSKKEENKEDKSVTTTFFKSEFGLFGWRVEMLNKLNISEERVLSIHVVCQDYR